MAARTRTPHTALARLTAEAGTGNEQLARKVNTAGSELGLRLRYDKSTVSHWLRGSVPKKGARPAVAEALSRLPGRPVLPPNWAGAPGLTRNPTSPRG
ncbi:hypothetical protein ACE14D_09900 [Streptomyces sp. Act-28]